MKRRLVYFQLVLALGLFLGGIFLVPIKSSSFPTIIDGYAYWTPCCDPTDPTFTFISHGGDCIDGGLYCVRNPCPAGLEACESLAGE
jgi:hypothetical protein